MQALIQAKDFDGAIALLEDFAAKNPKRPRALTLLASANEQKGGLDGDGHADLVVGAWQSASAAPSGGKVTLHSGKDGHVLKAITCRIPGDTFG